MVTVSVEGANLVLVVEGIDKLWALKSRLEMPLAHIRSVCIDPPEVHDWWKGIKAYGSSIPGVLTAGTFYYHDRRIFWDVHHPENAIGIDLHDERYDQIIIEVADPAASIALLEASLGQLSGE
jgi:hypothetical protein